jgi:hypothetical protein
MIGSKLPGTRHRRQRSRQGVAVIAALATFAASLVTTQIPVRSRASAATPAASSLAVNGGSNQGLVNGGFNHGFGSWQAMPLTSATVYGPGVVGSDPYEGTGFVATNSSDTSGSGGIYQDVPATINPGDTFCASAQVGTQGAGSGAAGTFAVWLNGAGGSQENSFKTLADMPGGNAWTPVQTCVTATAVHSNVRVQFYVAPNHQTLVVDNVDLHGSLAVNGGFNHGFGSWQAMPLTSATVYGPGVVGSDPYEGTGFVATNSSDTSGSGGIYQDVPATINPGDTFCASAQVGTQGAGSGAAGTFAVWLNGAGGSQENSFKTLADMPGGNAWTPVQTCVTATAVHSNVRVQFYVAPNHQTLVVDNAAVSGTSARRDCTRSWPTGKVFVPGETYRGCNGEKLTYQSDGQVVLYSPDGQPQWTTGKQAPQGMLVFQHDGNLVQYAGTAPGSPAVWASNTGTSAALLSFGPDGNLVLFDNRGTQYPLWWSNRDHCDNYSWSTGKVFLPGEYYVSCSGDMLTMRGSDGNIMQINSLGQVEWASNTSAPGGRMTFQGDGNLVAYNSGGQAVWATNVPAGSDGKLEFTADGHVLELNSAGIPVYAGGDNDKELLRRRLEEIREQVREMCNDPGRLWEGKQAQCDWMLNVRIPETLVKLNSWTPGQPCTNASEIFASALSVIGAVWSIIQAMRGTPSTTNNVITAGNATRTVDSLLDIFWRCMNWRSLEDLLRQAKEQQRQIGFTSSIGVTALPIGSEIGIVNASAAGLPGGKVASLISGAFVEGHPEWSVEFGEDPQTTANTVEAEVETTRNGVRGTLFTMRNGDTVFVPQGNVNMSILYDRDNAHGTSVRTIYDEHGNYVITVDSERGLVNVNDGWGGNNPFNAANGGWGWGWTGYSNWYEWAGGHGDTTDPDGTGPWRTARPQPLDD